MKQDSAVMPSKHLVQQHVDNVKLCGDTVFMT